MFDITLNGKQLYHPNSLDCNITKAVIHESLNDSGYMDIIVPYSNPLYDELIERQGKIVVYKDGSPFWYGELIDIAIDFEKNKILYIVGEAAYLNDTVQPQYEYKDMTKFQIFSEIIAKHNSMVEKEKQFSVGMIGANAMKTMTIVTDWEYSLDAIREHLCDDEEYFRIRHIGDTRYIDIMPLDSYGRRSEQSIMFGENLLDYIEESCGENIATVCIPLGKTLDEGGIEGYENYLTCESANDGKNYVYIPKAVETIGWITKVVHFNVLDNADALKTAGINYLKEKQFARLTLKLSAVDMSILNNYIDDYSLGDYVRAICEPMGMDGWFPIREKESDLINIANNKIIVGSTGTKSFTEKQKEEYKEIEKIIPNKDGILADAKKNAAALINGNGDNGYVAILQNEQGKPYEIVVMDASSIEQSSKAWRWNLNGFGFGTKEAGAKADFNWNPKAAITMDGSIVADYITTGTIKVGGGNQVNSLEIYDSTGQKKLVYFDNQGMHLENGQKIAWDDIDGTSDVLMKDQAGGQYITTITKDTVKSMTFIGNTIKSSENNPTFYIEGKTGNYYQETYSAIAKIYDGAFVSYNKSGSGGLYVWASTGSNPKGSFYGATKASVYEWLQIGTNSDGVRLTKDGIIIVKGGKASAATKWSDIMI